MQLRALDGEHPADTPFVAVFSGSARTCAERALVLTALSLPHHELRTGAESVLLVPRAHAARALAELARYEGENRAWPPVEEPFRPLGNGAIGGFAFAGLLGLVHVLSSAGAFGADWRAAGVARAALVRAEEPWRAVTALTLHADPAHLTANALFGALFGSLLAHSLGHGRAWLGMLLAGALGNLLNAWLRPVDQASIGASTAVFGALGLLGSVEWRRRGAGGARRLQRAAPILGTAALLGLLGMSGDGGTDYGAHAAGWLAGFALGFVIAPRGAVAPLGRRAELALVLAAPLVLAASWIAALSLS